MRVKYFLAYFIPILTFLVLDQFLGREYYSVPTDNTPGQYGLSLNLIFGVYNLAFHLPEYSFIALQSLLALFVLDQDSLDAFYVLGFGLNIVFAIISSFLVAYFSNLIRINIYIPIILSLIALSMPTVATLATQVGAYFPLGILSPALGLGLYVLMSSEKNLPWVALIVLSLFGFFAANLFLVLPIIIAILAGFFGLYFLEGPDKFFIRFLKTPLNHSKGIKVLEFAAILMAYRGIYDFFHVTIELRTFGNTNQWIIVFILTLGSLYLIYKRPLLLKLWRAMLAPIAFGWFISSHIYVHTWGLSAGRAMLKKGGADPQISFLELLEKADFWAYINIWSWHWLPIISFAIAIVAIVAEKNQKKFKSIQLFAFIFVSISFLLTFLMIYSVSFINLQSAPESYGFMDRYIILILIVIAFIITMASQSSYSFIRFVSFFSVFIVISFSFYDYVVTAKKIMPIYNKMEILLQEAVTKHLAQDSKNNVVCLGSLQPRPCAMLYGLNNYRWGPSLNAFRNTLQNRRITYATPPFPEIYANLNQLPTLYIGLPPIIGPSIYKVLTVVQKPSTFSTVAFKLIPQ